MSSSEYNKLYHLRNRNKINKRARLRAEVKRREEGVSLKVNRNISVSCKDNKKEYDRQYHNKWRSTDLYKKKVRTLQAISGLKIPICCKCGINDIRLLVINHVNGDGGKESLRINPHLFRESILNGTRESDDLDIRCHNCNYLYEYERGRLKMPENWSTIYKELVE